MNDDCLNVPFLQALTNNVETINPTTLAFA
jgi:hypothetical protein